MKSILVLLLTGLSLSVFSQTKLISYKSHSGNMKNFAAAEIDIADGNLGVAPDRIIRTAKLDSVIYINEKESIFVTSSTCKNRSGEKTEWKPGREVLYNSKLFSSKNTDSIRTILKDEYYFQNNIDEVIFSGFPATTKKEIRKQKKKQKKTLNYKKSTTDNSRKSAETPYYIGILFLTSLAGVYSWKKNK